MLDVENTTSAGASCELRWAAQYMGLACLTLDLTLKERQKTLLSIRINLSFFYYQRLIDSYSKP